MRTIIRRLAKQAQRIQEGEDGRLSDTDLEKLIRIAYALKDLALTKGKLAEIVDMEWRLKALERQASFLVQR
jgi:hypothetical protein